MAEIWDLLKSIFWILAGIGVFVVAYLFSGGMFNNGICAFLAYVAIFCILIGITAGMLAIIDHNRRQKEKEE